ncbi:uncharacterized protein LOC123719940 isoform X2 [Pieris brassicae]|uniref:uncharacterized protein LOC123719940 isoform X2 n=1 Tax=Pieris brassicae TaxID=7116 RepID=UPI001E66276B|nr:uncharacterized protein LOC123719940 isoform X2 [Pieris brassicae]
MWRFGLILLLVTASKQFSLSDFEVPDYMKAGGDVPLKCGYELKSNESDKGFFVKWWWSPMNGSSEERSLIYQRIVGHPPDALRHNIEIVQGDDILLRNVTVKDSGVYECEVSNIVDEVRQYEPLIVFSEGTGVELEFSTVEDGPDTDDDEDVFVTCEALGVAPYPDLTFTVDGEAVNATDLVIESEDSYDIYSNVTLSSDLASGHEISCLLTFSTLNISDVAFLVTQVYNEAGFTTESPTEMASTEAPENVENNSKGDICCSWLLVAMPLISSYFMYLI